MKRSIILLAVVFFPWVFLAGLLSGYWMGRGASPAQVALPGPTAPPEVATVQARSNIDTELATWEATVGPAAAQATTAAVFADIDRALNITPTPDTTAIAASLPCDPGLFKGDLATRIYYAPGQKGYAAVKTQVRCIRTEQQAEATGFRKAEE